MMGKNFNTRAKVQQITRTAKEESDYYAALLDNLEVDYDNLVFSSGNNDTGCDILNENVSSNDTGEGAGGGDIVVVNTSGLMQEAVVQEHDPCESEDVDEPAVITVHTVAEASTTSITYKG